MHQFHKFTYFE